MNRGFTLLEVIIYIALFSLLMGTAFVTAYQLVDSSSRLNTKTAVQEEGNFVMRKLNWALTGLDSLALPSGPSCEQTLAIYKTNYLLNPIIIGLNKASSSIEINNIPLTTQNVEVTCLSFEIIPAIGSGPTGVSATANINGIPFTITKYERL